VLMSFNPLESSEKAKHMSIPDGQVR
jgi:hypothetical protein